MKDARPGIHLCMGDASALEASDEGNPPPDVSSHVHAYSPARAGRRLSHLTARMFSEIEACEITWIDGFSVIMRPYPDPGAGYPDWWLITAELDASGQVGQRNGLRRKSHEITNA